MKLRFKKGAVLLLLICLLSCTAFALPDTDTANHASVNDAQHRIPRKITALTEKEGWLRDEKNLLTNFYSMYSPEVVYIPERDNGEDYPYLMYFFAWAYTQENDPQPSSGYPGYPGGDAIFLARAKAVEGPWEVYSKNYNTGEDYWDCEMKPFYWQPIITCGDTWYDSWHVGDCSIVYEDGVFHMAFSAMGCDEDGIPSHKPEDTDGNASCIMGATSEDGIHFVKSAAPLLVWKDEKGYNEKLNDYASNFGGYQRPSIMREDGIWKCWFDFGAGQAGSRIGYAVNRGDFMNAADWEYVSIVQDAEHQSDAHKLTLGVDMEVVKIGSIYYGYGDPYTKWFNISDPGIPSYSTQMDVWEWSNRQIVEYQSTDGIDWKVTGYFLPDTGVDANQIPQPFIDHKNNRLCIFYATQRGTRPSKNSYDWRWDSIRMMYKELKYFSDEGVLELKTAPATLPTASPSAAASPSDAPTVGNSTASAAPSPSAGGIDSPKQTAAWIIPVCIAVALLAIAVICIYIFRKKKPIKK